MKERIEVHKPPAPKKMTVVEKTKLFFTTESFLTLASTIVLFTWIMEKKTMAKHNNDLAEFYRYEHMAGLSANAITALETQRGMTEMNRDYYYKGKDSDYYKSYFINVANEIQQQNSTLYTLKLQRDVEEGIANKHIEELNTEDSQVNVVIRSGKRDDIQKMMVKANTDYPFKAAQIIYNVEGTYFHIRTTIKWQSRLYVFLYLLAAFLFAVDRIDKVKAVK